MSMSRANACIFIAVDKVAGTERRLNKVWGGGEEFELAVMATGEEENSLKWNT